MIKVRNLSKYYGYTTAVKNLSFDVKKGEVLGLLGPNGAGKTTTMKILTCFLPPSSGTAEIFGYDILNRSMEVRKLIGYLPEKAPMYHELSVRDYLEFAAAMKGVDKSEIENALDYVIEKCSLQETSEKIIGTLSKGFRQRVGIAQAIINNPRLLILDEPTIGLDPKQILDIRNLIKSIGRDRTIILSSHILPEVNEVCDRIIIINRGRLVAVDSPANLREKLTKSAFTIIKIRETSSTRSASEILSEIEGVLSVRKETLSDDITKLTVESKPEIDPREIISSELVKNGYPLLEIYNRELSLEDIFMQLVTRE